MFEEVVARLEYLSTASRVSRVAVASLCGFGVLHKVDRLKKTENYFQMFHLHLKSSAEWLKHGQTVVANVKLLEWSTKTLKSGLSYYKLQIWGWW